MALFMMEISKTAEVAMAAGAIIVLAMGTFGLDSIVFSKKRKEGRDPRAPKQRISYVVEDLPEEPAEKQQPRR